MAKNKENKGLFGVEDIITNTKQNVQEKDTLQKEMKPTKKAATRRIIKRETKSKRINLLVRPSEYEALASLAEEKGISLNELIGRFISEHIK